MTRRSGSAPSDVQRVEFRCGDAILVGDRWDADNPAGTVLLLHGGGQTRHSWFRTGRQLASNGWNAISLDARGHGDSGWAVDGRYTMDVLVADLEAVVATLDEQPVLVGASMGGSTSLLAQGERRLARALVLVDIVPVPDSAGIDRIMTFLRSAPDGFDSLQEAAQAVRDYNPHRTRTPSPHGLRKNLRQRANGRWHWHWDPNFLDLAPTAADVTRLQEAARKVTVPTLLIRGQQSDVVTPAGVRGLLDVMPHASYVDVSGTGHMVAGDDNDVFTHHLLKFLAESAPAPE
jgi:pimeloyl-ACP methyl ester carboxylesterase